MKKIIAISIQRKVTVAMFTIAVLIFGVISFTRLHVSLLPDLTYPTVTIRTDFSTAAPVEVENLITKPIEETCGVIKNLIRISSVSRPGQSDVGLEFAWGTDMDMAILEIREKMDTITLPLEAERPVIMRFDPALDPVMRFGLLDTRKAAPDGKMQRLKGLRYFSDEVIKKRLENVPGIAAVKISGGLEEEIEIEVDQLKLARLSLTIEKVIATIAAENVNLSGGNLDEGSHRFLIKTVNRYASLADIQEVVVSRQKGIPVHLKDIATVRRGHKEQKGITRVKGEEAVEIAIYKEGDANVVAVAKAVNAKIEQLQKELPKRFGLEALFDQSTFIREAVMEVIWAGIIGGLLATVILYAFLRNFWATVIISVSIPVSVVATFNLMYGNHLTLNIMSLGGITLGIGMLLDNAIVVLENIFRQRELGKDFAAAAKEGAGEVVTAVIASTLTTIAVFFPLVFVQGIAGQLFRDQALTITFALIISLVVALTIIPMLASLGQGAASAPRGQQPPATRRGLRKTGWVLFTLSPALMLRALVMAAVLMGRLVKWFLTPFWRLFQLLYDGIDKNYPGLLGLALRQRMPVVIICLAAFIGALRLTASLGVELIPTLSQGEFKVEMQLPAGTPLAVTDKVVGEIQEKIDTLTAVDTTFALVGTGNRFKKASENGGENSAEISVLLKPGLGRTEEEAVMQAMRQLLEEVPDLDHKVLQPSLFTLKTPVEVEIAGFDLAKQERVSRQLVAAMQATGRFQDVESSMGEGQPEVQIVFDREKAAALGLKVPTIAKRIVNKVKGEVATRYQMEERKIDILVRTAKNERTSFEDMGRLIVNPESERPVSLDSIATISMGQGPAEIRRVGQERVALVSANLSTGDLGSAVTRIESLLAAIDVPPGISMRISGQNQEMQVSFRSLQLALLLAIFLVYLVMASQFESFLHPLVILISIPLAIIGAALGLWLTGSKISVIVLIGAILLAGIVVNNAIVLIDKINQLRDQGLDKLAAIMAGGQARIRPILMTTLTTTLGLLPMAVGLGEGAEIRAPMAITVIGGLLGSTILTLVVIPVVYSIIDRRK